MVTIYVLMLATDLAHTRKSQKKCSNVSLLIDKRHTTYYLLRRIDITLAPLVRLCVIIFIKRISGLILKYIPCNYIHTLP